jgi:hypothetical protein
MDFKGLGEFAITEPESSANTDYQPVYPYNNVTRTPSGHYLEFDDTPMRERVRLQHRTGTFIEMHPDGNQVNHIFGDSYHIMETNGYVLIKGNCSVVVEGDASLDFQGDLVHHVAGDYKLVVDGDYDIIVAKQTTLVGKGDVDIKTSPEGTVTLGSVGTLLFEGDLRVNGELRAESIYSTGSIKAADGIHAGVIGAGLNPYAGISTLGGIAQGFPTASPGVISGIGLITAPVVLAVELIDHSGPMSIFRSIYNLHIHASPRGLTGTPITPVIP